MTTAPSATASVAFSAPTTAGMPSSRATIAAWQVRPPRLVTIAAARFITGSQSGVVVSATSTSPSRNACELARVGDQPGSAGGDLGADRAAAGQHLALALDHILLDCAGRPLRGHGLGPRLDDVELVVEAIQGPLDVHGRGPAGALE